MAETTKTGLTFTGERFVPGQGGAGIAYEHYHRYSFAQGLARGKTVLDLGCGEGYGANLLAETAESVTGIDLSAEAIEHARSHYPRTSLNFMTGDCRRTGLPEHQFDLVVCFELVEHIAEHEELLAEVCRLLKSDGVLVISSPDKEFYSDAVGYRNPFHVKELYARDFRLLLERYFPHVMTFSQRVSVGSILQRAPVNPGIKPAQAAVVDMRREPDGTFRHAGAEAVEARYIIGVCSAVSLDSGIQDLTVSLWSDKSETLLRELEDSIREQQSHNGQLQEAINDRDVQILQGYKAVEERSSEVSRLSRVLSEKDQMISNQAGQLLSREGYVQDLERTVQILRDFEKKVKNSLLWRAYYSLVRPIRGLFHRSGSASQ